MDIRRRARFRDLEGFATTVFVAKRLLPGLGRTMCWGLWGVCEAEGYWRPAWRVVLCESCNERMTHFPDGKPARQPPPGYFIRPRFWIWNPPPEVKKTMSYEMDEPKMSFVPFESEDLEVVHRWALQEFVERRHPGIVLMYMLPNAARRSFVLMLGIEKPELAPNICVPVAKGGYGALYLQLRHTKEKHRKEDEFNVIMAFLRETGNAAVTAYGSDEAIAFIQRYFDEQPLLDQRPDGA